MTGRRLNVPNAVGALRLLLSPGLVLAASAGREGTFLLLFLALELTDLLDGFLARTLHQQTAFGTRVDSVADLVMYTCLLAGLVVMEGGLLLGEWPWMAAAVLAYALSWASSLAKFGRVPSYHTWAAKASSFLVVAAVVVLVLRSDPLGVRVAAVVVTLANLEAILLTRILDQARPDLPSVLLLLRRR